MKLKKSWKSIAALLLAVLLTCQLPVSVMGAEFSAGDTPSAEEFQTEEFSTEEFSTGEPEGTQEDVEKQNEITDSEYVYSDTKCITAADGSVLWEGEGTAEKPYCIESAADLEALCDKVNTEGYNFEGTYFQLTEDITLPENWKPVGVTKDGKKDLKDGDNLNVFSGVLDGNNHTITVPEGGLPLFGYVRNTEVRNLNIYGKKIAGYGLVNNFEGVGLSGSAVVIDNVTLKSGSSTLKAGLVGANKTVSPYAGCSSGFGATIKNCTIEKGVVIGYDKDEDRIGSFAGRMQGTITNCVSYAIVYGKDYVGGIIGTRDNAMGECTVTDCKFYGDVIASGQQAGGIMGGGYDDSSAPNGRKATIDNCMVEGTVTGQDKVGGILGSDIYVAQAWNNCAYTMKNNVFAGKVKATGEEAAYIGGIIGFYDSLNRIDDIENNSYAADCGAEKGIGFVKYVDTSCTTHETASGAVYFNTEIDTSDCPKNEVTGCWWLTKYNRTDDPLGADAEKLTRKYYTEHTHKYVWKTIAKATVFRAAKQEGTCSVCGEKTTRNYGSKLKAVIKLNLTSVTLQKKQSTNKVKVTMAYGDSVKSWTSSNKKIVIVDKKGVLKAQNKTGTAKVTVILKSGKKATLKVNVQTGKVRTVKISGLKSAITLKKGTKVTLKPVISPVTSREKVTYTISNKKIVAVNTSGVIYGKKKGIAYLTVSSGKVRKKIKITVK